MDRNPNGSGLIRDRSGNGLADPPSRIGREFVAPAILEFLDRFHQPHVSLLYQVEKGKASVSVFFRDTDDEAQIGFDHFRLGPVGLPHTLPNPLHDAQKFGRFDMHFIVEFGQPSLDFLRIYGSMPAGSCQFRQSEVLELGFYFSNAAVERNGDAPQIPLV